MVLLISLHIYFITGGLGRSQALRMSLLGGGGWPEGERKTNGVTQKHAYDKKIIKIAGATSILFRY